MGSPTIRDHDVAIRMLRLTARILLGRAKSPRFATAASIKKQKTKDSSVEASEWNNYPTETEALQKSAKKCKTKKSKVGKQTNKAVKCPSSDSKVTQKVVDTPSRKIVRKPDVPYKDNLKFSKIGEVLYWDKNYQFSITVGQELLQMHFNLLVLGIGAVLSLILGHALDLLGWMVSANATYWTYAVRLTLSQTCLELLGFNFACGTNALLLTSTS